MIIYRSIGSFGNKIGNLRKMEYYQFDTQGNPNNPLRRKLSEIVLWKLWKFR